MRHITHVAFHYANPQPWLKIPPLPVITLPTTTTRPIQPTQPASQPAAEPLPFERDENIFRDNR
jgi:hypothetical protein